MQSDDCTSGLQLVASNRIASVQAMSEIVSREVTHALDLKQVHTTRA